MTSGSQANNNGQEFEGHVERFLQTMGFEKIDAALLFRNRKSLPSGKYYARQVYVGESIYQDKKRKADLLVVDTDIFPDGLIMECKWQDVGGSKEESFPYLVACIKKTGIQTVVILDGGGYTRGAEQYLKAEIDGIVFLAVWGMRELQRAKNKGFFGTGVLPPRQNAKQAENVRLWDMEEIG